MAIKSKLKNKRGEISYPCLMMSKDGAVILFTDRTTGTLLRTCSGMEYTVGEWANDWVEADDPYWKPSPPITLSNV